MTTSGGEAIGMQTNQAPVVQTVVVVQQPVATGQAPAVQQQTNGDYNRYPRWAYLVFSIGFFAYHFMMTWLWLVLSFSEYGGLFFFCGVVPSLTFWIMMICDGTVFCANGDTRADPVTRICCCGCANGFAMMIPLAICALLRFILWCAMFGIFADLWSDIEGDAEAIDNFFWFFLSFTALDCGPAIYLALDWYFYYVRMDYDGILGTRDNPIRCIVAQMSVVFIICWAFIAVFEELATDNAAEFFWPWIVYGLIATCSLIFGAFLHFSGSIKGNLVSNGLFRIGGMILGAGIVVMNLIVWGYFLDFAFSIADYLNWGGFTFVFIVYAMYLSSISIPTCFAFFGIKVGDVTNNNNQQQPAV